MGGPRKQKQKSRDYSENNRYDEKMIARLEKTMNGEIKSNKRLMKEILGGSLPKTKWKNTKQKAFSDTIKDNEYSICHGTAGTGKSYVAIATALELLFDPETPYENIYLIKSVTPLKGEEVGFLKGGLEEKLGAYMASFYNIGSKIIGEKAWKDLVEQKIIREQGLFQMRGFSLDNAILIVDEAQNISIDNMRTVMTRLGENGKLIIFGDTKQVDMKVKRESSLQFIARGFENVKGFGVFKFLPEDVVRNPLIKVIEDIFDNEYPQD